MWYYHNRLKPQGPLSREEIVYKIQKGDIRPTDLLLHEVQQGENDWLPAESHFAKDLGLFPAYQEVEMNPHQVSFLTQSQWVILNFQTSSKVPQQVGPMNVDELIRYVKGHPQDKHHCWRPGLTGWACVQDRPEFKAFFSSEAFL